MRDVKAEKDLDEWLNNHKPLFHNEIKKSSDISKKIEKKNFFSATKFCPFGSSCSYTWKCKYIHSSEFAKQRQDKEFDQQKFRERKKTKFKFDLSRYILEGIKGLKKIKENNLNILKKQILPANIFAKELIRHDAHEHELKFGVRKFVYLICDQCNCYFNGASWFCKNGCDFDLCLACSAKQNSKREKNKL